MANAIRENDPTTILMHAEKRSARASIRCAQALGDQSQTDAGLELDDLSAAMTSRVVRLQDVKSVSDASLAQALYRQFLPDGPLRDCLMARAFLAGEPFDRRAKFLTRSHRALDAAQTAARQAHDPAQRTALRVTATSFAYYLRFLQETSALQAVERLEAFGATEHATSLRHSVSDRCQEAAKRILNQSQDLRIALSWREWSMSLPDLDDSERAKLFATREAVALANAPLAFLHQAARMTGDPDGRIAEAIVAAATELARTSFVSRSLEIAQLLSDPRTAFNAAATLARVQDQSAAAGDALALAATLEAHTGSHLDFHPPWMRVAIRYQDHMVKAAKAADAAKVADNIADPLPNANVSA